MFGETGYSVRAAGILSQNIRGGIRLVENMVKARRKELGMTLEQLSRESGVPVSTISDVERGIEPKVKTAQRIARALLRTVDELWQET